MLSENPLPDLGSDIVWEDFLERYPGNESAGTFYPPREGAAQKRVNHIKKGMSEPHKTKKRRYNNRSSKKQVKTHWRIILKRIVETLKNILLIFLISMIAQWANVKLSVNAEPLHQMNYRNIEPKGFNDVRQSSALDPFFELPQENQS